MRATILGLAVAAVLGGSPATADFNPGVRVSSYGGDAIFPTGLPWSPDGSSCYAYRCVWNAPHQQALILTRYRGGFLMRPITHQRAHWLQAAYCDRGNVTCD